MSNKRTFKNANALVGIEKLPRHLSTVNALLKNKPETKYYSNIFRKMVTSTLEVRILNIRNLVEVPIIQKIIFKTATCIPYGRETRVRSAARRQQHPHAPEILA